MSEASLQRHSANHYALSGPLTFATVPAVYRQASSLFPGDAGMDHPLELSLDSVGRCDSAGLALLLEWLRVARERGIELRLSGLPAQLEGLMRVSDLDEVLDSVQRA